MKKSIWLAIIGAAALAGCQNEVMQQREYVPAPREDVGPAVPQVADNTDMPVRQEVEPAQTRQDSNLPAPQELPTMTQTFRNDGFDEVPPSAGKDGKAAAGEYIVKSGDTPEKIARKHHVRLSALMEANNLTEGDAKRLRIGQKLVIPGKGTAVKKGGAAAPAKPAQPAKPAPNKENKPAVRPQSRDLEEGDDAPAATVELKRIEIDDGYAVDIPKDMTVEEFATIVDVPVAKLRELNPDMPAKQLKKGSTFIIPKN